jgi:hypothetical protein
MYVCTYLCMYECIITHAIVKVWTVAQAVNFQLVPLDYRVLFGNVVALWWNIYLSLVNAHSTS